MGRVNCRPCFRARAVKIGGLSKYHNKGFNLDDNICSELQAGRGGWGADGWKLFLI